MFFLILIMSAGAGVAGAVLGLGGGTFIVPALTLVLKLPIRYAIGASIVSVIATSSGAAAAYIRDHLTNLRIGIALEVMTVLGAFTGAFAAGHVSPRLLYVIFGILLAYSAIALLGRLKLELPGEVPHDPLAARLRFAGHYYDQALRQRVPYEATGVIPGGVMMYLAGVLSGLLGIGSGLFKVLAMDIAMRLPMKVSTSTSNFMIGVTAAASAGVYFARGDVYPLVVAPVALGVLGGAWVGTRILGHLRNTTIRKLFIPILAVVAVSMIVRGLGLR
ncbi:MAG TPA: sulfite exporter TauE/SafE family protein [bacterium]|nr:sulfite exporter TauE/SafE family protein [bacterium]